MFPYAPLRRVFGLPCQSAKPIDARVEALEPRIAPTAGVLDFTFSTDGVLAQDFGIGSTDNDGAEAVVIQPDGKIVVAGFTQRATAGPSKAAWREVLPHFPNSPAFRTPQVTAVRKLQSWCGLFALCYHRHFEFLALAAANSAGSIGYSHHKVGIKG
jgi:hypothetical protein